MTITISDKIIKQKGLSKEAVKTELAVWLYQKEIFTLAQAAKFLEISRLEMQKELKLKNVHLHISAEDVEDDFQTLSSLKLI